VYLNFPAQLSNLATAENAVFCEKDMYCCGHSNDVNTAWFWQKGIIVANE
jgi:hypothetical protein